MTTRRRLLVFGLLAGALVLGASVWLFWPRGAITRENSLKVDYGMTRMTVEAILGGPARDDRTVTDKLPDEDRWRLRRDEELEWHVEKVLSKALNGLKGPVTTTWEWWRSNDTEIAVEFDEAGRVWCLHVYKARAPQARPLHWVRRWLRL